MTLTTIATEPHRITADNAGKIRKWFEERGGIALWQSVNLSNPTASWTTPMKDRFGGPPEKPTWEAAGTPYRVITSQDDVVVDVPKVVKRFHVAVRRSGGGMMLKLTDGATRRVRREVARAGENAWYEFDYGAYENCVILAPDKSVKLSEWEAQ